MSKSVQEVISAVEYIDLNTSTMSITNLVSTISELGSFKRLIRLARRNDWEQIGLCHSELYYTEFFTWEIIKLLKNNNPRISETLNTFYARIVKELVNTTLKNWRV